MTQYITLVCVSLGEYMNGNMENYLDQQILCCYLKGDLKLLNGI